MKLQNTINDQLLQSVVILYFKKNYCNHNTRTLVMRIIMCHWQSCQNQDLIYDQNDLVRLNYSLGS